MKYYLDFEALRFSEVIISVGVVAENGKTFYSLCQPNPTKGRRKVDDFITELTGITQEDLMSAPLTDKVFENLFDYFMDNFDGSINEFYVYGSSDDMFLRKTLATMRSYKAIACAQMLIGNLIDYTDRVKKFFNVDYEIALRKLYTLIQLSNNFEQHHNALKDAQMLQSVVQDLASHCSPKDLNLISAMPSTRTVRPKTTKAPDIFVQWDTMGKIDKHLVPTGATAANWVLKATNVEDESQVVYFPDEETAALWLIKFCARNMSPKNKGHVNSLIQRIRADVNDLPSKSSSVFGYSWERSKKQRYSK